MLLFVVTVVGVDAETNLNLPTTGKLAQHVSIIIWMLYLFLLKYKET